MLAFRVACFALLAATLAGPAAATPFEGTLRFGVFVDNVSMGLVLFNGSGSGSSGPSGITVGSGVFAGYERLPSTGRYPGYYHVGAGLKVAGLRAGTAGGTPLSGAIGVEGSIRPMWVSENPTLFAVNVPLFTGHTVMSAAGEVGFGIGGSFAFSGYVPPTRYVHGADFRVTATHARWSAVPFTHTFMTYYLYHIAAGAMISQPVPIAYTHTSRVTGSDSRTPGGLGQITLVSPSRIHVESQDAFWDADYLVLGTLTLQFVPEPGTLALVGSGVALLALYGARRTRSLRRSPPGGAGGART